MTAPQALLGRAGWRISGSRRLEKGCAWPDSSAMWSYFVCLAMSPVFVMIILTFYLCISYGDPTLHATKIRCLCLAYIRHIRVNIDM